MIDLSEKNISEIIVNHTINKIISLTISRALKLKTDKDVPNNCFEYVKDTINNILSSYYILYEKDEPRIDNGIDNNKSFFKSDVDNIKKNSINNEDNNNISNTIFLEKTGDDTNMFFKNYFFNNLYRGDNDWDLIEEPTSLKLDRYSSTLINFKEINKNPEDKYNKNHEGILEVVDENEENITKTKNNSSILDKEKEKEISQNKGPLKRRTSVFKKTNIIEQKQRLKDIANQFECYDLEPEENHEVLETEQIKMLRQQFELGKKNKDNEQKIIHEEKEKSIINQKLEEENMRKYVGKKINKDHNGQIIFIKSIKPEKFKQDFIFGRTKFKTININNEKIQKKKKEQKEQNKNNEKNTQENENKNKEKSPKKGSKKSIKSLPKIAASKTKSSMATIEVKDKNDELRPLSLKRRMPIITSGSNFNIMNMEIGVSIKEDEKYKTGGLDFLSKFKKFSLQAYNKKLKEAEASNNWKKNIEIIDELKTKTIDEMNNYYPTNYTMGYNTSYGNNNFSSTQTDPNNFLNRNMKNKMYLTNNSTMFNQYLRNINNSNYKEKIQKNGSFNPYIHLTIGASSLINTMDNLNLIPNEEEKAYKRRKNIFREKHKNILRKENKFILDDINLFTKNLITNKRNEVPGDEKMRTIGGGKNPEKPNMREIIQEIGVKGKIMRNRSKILVPIKSNFLDNENFFKQ